MNELISGKEALIALANGEEVELQATGDMNWYDSTQWTVGELLCFKGRFRLKPRTITINNIEVPAPFEPRHRDNYWYVCLDNYCGYEVGKYTKIIKESIEFFNRRNQLGAWRTEEEIKQVVAALRSIFK